MRAIPKAVDESENDVISGISCVECPGVLTVSPEGTGPARLRFVCRVGHVFSTDEVIAGKERKLEEWTWASILAAEELASLLEDLARRNGTARQSAYLERVRQLRRQADAMRALIENNEPVDLSGDLERAIAARAQRERR